MIRYWHELYGVEPVSCHADWYELFVPRPPRTRHQAVRLLDEMAHFAEEISVSGELLVSMDNADDAIACVATSHYWHFWWD